MGSRSGDPWLGSYERAVHLASEIVVMIQERNLKAQANSPEASRATAAARRKLGSLSSALDNLREELESQACVNFSENEKNRRRDMITNLKGRREQMLHSLKRDHHSSNRAALMERQDEAQPSGRETLQTADLDNRGLLTLQQQVMRDQDAELAELEKSVTSTKHIALTVNEELDLQAQLLDELDEDVDVTHNRMRAAQKKLKSVLARSGNCRSLCITILLMVALAVTLMLVFKIVRLL